MPSGGIQSCAGGDSITSLWVHSLISVYCPCKSRIAKGLPQIPGQSKEGLGCFS